MPDVFTAHRHAAHARARPLDGRVSAERLSASPHAEVRVRRLRLREKSFKTLVNSAVGRILVSVPSKELLQELLRTPCAPLTCSPRLLLPPPGE